MDGPDGWWLRPVLYRPYLREFTHTESQNPVIKKLANSAIILTQSAIDQLTLALAFPIQRLSGLYSPGSP